MKAVAGLTLSLFLVWAAPVLRAQSDASLYLGNTGSGELTTGEGTITYTVESAGSISAANLYLNTVQTLSLSASATGDLLLQYIPTASTETITNILASSGPDNPLTITTFVVDGVSTITINGPESVTSTAIILGNNPDFATNVITRGSPNNGTSLSSGAWGVIFVGAGQWQLIVPSQGTQTYTPVAGLTPPSFTSSALQSNVTAGLNFNLIPSLTDFAGLGTTVNLLEGTASANRTVLTTFSAGPAGAASDDVNVSGTITDTYVLELSYSQAAALSTPGGPDAMRLDWLDPTTGQWENAVAGNTGGTPTFVDGAYNPATDFNLGTYGVDTANQEVWAVINHNSQFAADTQMVPEPGSLTFIFSGLTVLLGSRRFRKRN